MKRTRIEHSGTIYVTSKDNIIIYDSLRSDRFSLDGVGKIKKRLEESAQKHVKGSAKCPAI